MNRLDKIREAINQELKPEFINLEDESHLHAGHSSANSRGHFSLEIKSPQLRDLSLIAAHKKIYEALGELMQTDIHALSIKIIK